MLQLILWNDEMMIWRVRWRDDEWDKEMKFFFLVWTYIKPNLVLSEISEMKSEMKKWRDGKKIFWFRTYVKPNLVLSEISEMKRWSLNIRQAKCYLKLVRLRDEKKCFFWVWTYVKPNLVLSEISEMKSEMKKWRDGKKNILVLNICQAKSGVIWN